MRLIGNDFDFFFSSFLCCRCHCRLACPDPRPVFRIVRRRVGSFVCRGPLPSIRTPFVVIDRHRSHPSLSNPRPFHRSLPPPPSSAMAYQAMQKSWFKMPAYSAMYNPAKKDIEAGDKSQTTHTQRERMQRDGRMRQRRRLRWSARRSYGDSASLSCCPVCAVAARCCCVFVLIRSVILNTGILQSLSEWGPVERDAADDGCRQQRERSAQMQLAVS